MLFNRVLSSKSRLHTNEALRVMRSHCFSSGVYICIAGYFCRYKTELKERGRKGVNENVVIVCSLQQQSIINTLTHSSLKAKPPLIASSLFMFLI